MAQTAKHDERPPTLGELIREARKDAGLTQKDVERLTGLDRNRLSAYENDREGMRVTQLERIADAIGLQLPWAKGRYLLDSLGHAA